MDFGEFGIDEGRNVLNIIDSSMDDIGEEEERRVQDIVKDEQAKAKEENSRIVKNMEDHIDWKPIKGNLEILNKLDLGKGDLKGSMCDIPESSYMYFPKPEVFYDPKVAMLLNEIWKEETDRIRKMEESKEMWPFPLKRIKRIMRMEEDCTVTSQSVLYIACKAVQLLVSDLTVRAFQLSTIDDDRILKKEHIIQAVKNSEMFDFLLDIVEEGKDQSENPIKQKHNPNIQ